MKNKLTKIYNIFKQIENMKGSTGWDQTDVFYFFYEEKQNYLNCWQLLYGLFSENKTLKPSVFGITLIELRKYSQSISKIYEFENNEEPILIATFERNSSHKISGTVSVEETSISEEKEITFVDGINVDLDEEIDFKEPQLIAWEIAYLKNENYPIKLQYGCTYVRRDGIISGQLNPVDGESSPGKNDMIFYDSENGLDYQINGKLIGGEYKRKNVEDLIAENFDYTSYLEDDKLSVGISFPAIPTKYPSSLNFVSDGLGGYVSYVTFEVGENSSEELRNFGLNVDWKNSRLKTGTWIISTNNGYYNEVEAVEIYLF